MSFAVAEDVSRHCARAIADVAAEVASVDTRIGNDVLWEFVTDTDRIFELRYVVGQLGPHVPQLKYNRRRGADDTDTSVTKRHQFDLSGAVAVATRAVWESESWTCPTDTDGDDEVVCAALMGSGQHTDFYLPDVATRYTGGVIGDVLDLAEEATEREVRRCDWESPWGRVMERRLRAAARACAASEYEAMVALGIAA
ncbi:MAG: hypothetical protein E6R06_18790 [Mycobacterium sp.]|nr:MAG: hypothetical protein E6R06_18790 [Mycobacterium sp.]